MSWLGQENMIQKNAWKKPLSIASLLLGIFLYVIISVRPTAPEYYAEGTKFDFFGADCWRVAENINDAEGINHYRDKVHPLSSLAATAPTLVLKRAFSCDNNTCGMRIYQVLFGTLGLFFFALVLHEVNPRPWAVVLPTVLLFCSSAAWKLWTYLPETSLYSFFSINLALYIFLRLQTREGLIASGVATLSGTITNGGLGFLLQFFSLKNDWKKLIGCAAATLGILFLLALLQRNVFPTSVMFFDVGAIGEEASYINKNLSEVPWRTLDFVISPLTLPWLPHSATEFSSITMLKAFFAHFGEQSRRVMVGFSLVVLVLAFAAISSGWATAKLWRTRQTPSSPAAHVALIRSVMVFVVAEYVLHLVYGDMPFLYSMQFLPAMLLAFMYFTASRHPKLYPMLVVVLIVATQEVNAGLYTFLSQH